MEHLKKHGIETAIHYPTPLPSLPAYQYLGYTPADFPVATRLQGEILSLPIYPELTEDAIRYVGETIRNFYNA
jgi:dTDP-4-amino-4,6-dideoxygalactose transaminase